MKNNEIIKGIIVSIFDAFKRGDTKEIEKHLHEEASVWDVFTTYMITGKKNLEKFHSGDQTQKKSRGDLSIELEEPKIREWNDFAIATYYLEFTYLEPNALEGKVRITDLFVLEKDQWKIMHHHEGLVPED
ncbi:MAG: YybH family protein [Gammaproteobacteria bacterium]